MRGKPAKIRIVAPDPVYKSVVVSKFINKVMYDGKKNAAERVVYDALKKASDIAKKPAMEIFEKAIENASPKVEVKARRVGGANYQVPTPINERRQQALAFRWIVDGARAKRKNTPVSDCLAEELVEAYKGAGNAIKKKEEVTRMAEANKAFAHLAWGANAAPTR